MFLLINNLVLLNLDAPSPWGIYFQDSATPQCEGLIELHIIYIRGIFFFFLYFINSLGAYLWLSRIYYRLYMFLFSRVQAITTQTFEFYSKFKYFIYGFKFWIDMHKKKFLAFRPGLGTGLSTVLGRRVKPKDGATLLYEASQSYSSVSVARVTRFSLRSSLATKNYSTKCGNNTTDGVNQLEPGFVTGFVYAEGSFMALIRKRLQGYNNVGWSVEGVFQIKLHRKDIKLLEAVRDYFGVGEIIKDREDSIVYIVRSIKYIHNIILPHFDKYPLKTQKYADYLLWRDIVIKMRNGEHLTNDGIKEIINIRASLNLGLSDTLKSSFPEAVAVARPHYVILPLDSSSHNDCEWVAGFTSGEGSFNVKVKESVRSKVGFQTFMHFCITQHSRDSELMESLINFFGCGQYSLRGKGNIPAGDYTCVKFSDISDKIIPFFQKHKIIGVKHSDLQDWCKVADLMQKGEHRTSQGLDAILSIKSGMNRGREWK